MSHHLPRCLTLVLSTLLMLSLAASSLAGPAAGDPEAKVRHLADGAIEYDTTDPFGNPVTIVEDPPLEKPIDHPWDDPQHKLFRGFEIEEQDQFPAVATATVDVYAIADEEYRAKHSNWTDRLFNIIETADNAYFRDFRINWIIQGYYQWSSNGSSASEILSDLATDGSGLPRGLAMGFTDDSNFDAGGIAYVYGSDPGTGFSVCKDQGMTSTTYALRHEIGHNYGASHDFGLVICLMNYTYAYSIDFFDPAHALLVNSHRDWF